MSSDILDDSSIYCFLNNYLQNEIFEKITILATTGHGRYIKVKRELGGHRYFLQTNGGEKTKVGDRCHLATRQEVPFSIYIDNTPFDIDKMSSVYDHLTRQERMAMNDLPLHWDTFSDETKLQAASLLFGLTNSTLKYLSGGRFSLRLRQTKIVPAMGNSDLCKEDLGFSLHITHEYGIGSSGCSLNEGLFFVYPSGLFTAEKKLTALTIIHEMGHGFFGKGHDEGIEENGIFASGTPFRDDYPGFIGLNTEQAFLLSWPLMPPVRHTI